MLVLSRKKDESIVINNDITIVVVEIRGDKVRLGIEAPKEVPVHRREVFEAIAQGEPANEPTPARALEAASCRESVEPQPRDAVPGRPSDPSVGHSVPTADHSATGDRPASG